MLAEVEFASGKKTKNLSLRIGSARSGWQEHSRHKRQNPANQAAQHPENGLNHFNIE
jgi:hypothetical protein